MFKTEEPFYIHQEKEFINTDIPGVRKIWISECLLHCMFPICLCFHSIYSPAKPTSLHSTRTEPRLDCQEELPSFWGISPSLLEHRVVLIGP